MSPLLPLLYRQNHRNSPPSMRCDIIEWYLSWNSEWYKLSRRNAAPRRRIGREGEEALMMLSALSEMLWYTQEHIIHSATKRARGRGDDAFSWSIHTLKLRYSQHMWNNTGSCIQATFFSYKQYEWPECCLAIREQWDPHVIFMHFIRTSQQMFLRIQTEF